MAKSHGFQLVLAGAVSSVACPTPASKVTGNVQSICLVMKNLVSYFYLLHAFTALLDAFRATYNQNFSRGRKRPHLTTHPRRFKRRPQECLPSSMAFPQRTPFLTQPMMHHLSPLALKPPTSSTP